MVAAEAARPAAVVAALRDLHLVTQRDCGQRCCCLREHCTCVLHRHQGLTTRTALEAVSRGREGSGVVWPCCCVQRWRVQELCALQME